MSKKTILHKNSYNTGMTKGSMQCPIHTNVGNVSHVYKSDNSTGHTFNNIGEQINKNDCGDYTQSCRIHVKKDKDKIIKTLNPNHDLASGDHTDEANAVQHVFGGIPEVYNKINKERFTQKRLETEATILYKNENYDGNKSIADSSLCSLIKNKLLKINKSEIEYDAQKIQHTTHSYNTQAICRPVVCPVTNCAKLVAIDSIMSHFYFDHSRVPRITVITSEPHVCFVKSANISSETECIAMLFIKILGSSSQISESSDCVSYVNSLNQHNKLLLLMAARLEISTVKLSKCDDGKHVLKRNNSTQTSKMDFNKYIDINKHSAKAYKTESQLNINKPENFNDEDIILLWLCKLDAKEKTFTIIITREDHKLSYGYTGDALHFKDKQDPLSVYERPECLIVRGKAINKLLDSEHNIKIIVNCID